MCSEKGPEKGTWGKDLVMNEACDALLRGSRAALKKPITPSVVPAWVLPGASGNDLKKSPA